MMNASCDIEGNTPSADVTSPAAAGYGQRPADHGQRADQSSADDPHDGESPYVELCGRAIAALVLAAVSALALTHTAFWPIPVVAAILSLSALRRIRDLAPDLGGRRIALAALAISLIFGLSAPLQPFVHNYAMRAQSIEAANEWFQALRAGDSRTAHQLTLPKWSRAAVATSLKRYYSQGRALFDKQRYDQNPAVDLLLNLGPSAHVRFYANLDLFHHEVDDFDQAVDAYLVESPQRPERAYYVRLTLTRRLDLMRKLRSWEVTKAELVEDPSKLADIGPRRTNDVDWHDGIRKHLRSKLDTPQ